MAAKQKLVSALESANEKFFSQFGFYFRDVTFSKIVDYLHTPKDSSSLAVTRILFGLAMLFDIIGERGGATMEKRWGDPNMCHFPLLPFLQPLPMPYMAIVYAGLWFGAIGIMLGRRYRFNACMFAICYWYLFLVEKSYWNNHSYLFGIVAVLLTFCDANCYWSLDAKLAPSLLKNTVPYWNYFILKYQFFILYFMAGMKKGTAEWLTGYSVQNLSEHWVFEPFKLFLTVPQIDFLVVHCFVFVFDLTVAFWMMYSRTRHVAMIFCALFHLMNSRLFAIGMFPWVCLATMPLFYPFDWPRVILQKLDNLKYKIQSTIHKLFYDILNTCVFLRTLNEDVPESPEEDFITEEENVNDHIADDQCDHTEDESQASSESYDSHHKNRFGKTFHRKRMTVYLIAFHVITQLFLPYSHFITKGYNNWTNGLYGYSWDMMVHTWETHSAIIKVVKDESNFFLDPYAFSPNDRWTRHSDMAHQYAKCLKERVQKFPHSYNPDLEFSNNISIYVDVWCSLNGRFAQRHFDSKVDLLKVDWSPFTTPSYLMPLLDEALAWRSTLEHIRDDVLSWGYNTYVTFLADFPGYEYEKYISLDLRNVTLTVLEGQIVYQPQVTKNLIGQSFLLNTGDHIKVEIGISHKVLTKGNKPAFYMYTYSNITQANELNRSNKLRPILPIGAELQQIYGKFIHFHKIMLKSFVRILSNCTTCQYETE